MSNPEENLVGQGNKSITVEEYDELMALKVELRQRRVQDKVKAVGKNKVIWRQTMVWRRVDQVAVAPDEDLVAYSTIHGLKKTGDPKQKVPVTDNEIVAYQMLDPDFNRVVTLPQLIAKIDELKKAGVLTAAGDNPDNGEDVEEQPE